MKTKETREVELALLSLYCKKVDAGFERRKIKRNPLILGKEAELMRRLQEEKVCRVE